MGKDVKGCQGWHTHPYILRLSSWHLLSPPLTWVLQINSAPILFYLKWMGALKQYVLLQILKDIFFCLSIRVKTPNLTNEERLIQQLPKNLKFCLPFI